MVNSSPSSPSVVNTPQSRLLAWFAQHGRDLPWRRTRDPYAVLVSEVMLQQTQVDRVLPKYAEFLERFPTFGVLAAAGVGDVIRAWAPLGYNLRAVRLHRLAQKVAAQHGGTLPADPAILRRMTGIGPYTAAAVDCFAFGSQVAVIDTNVRRVLGRYLLGTPTPLPKDLERLAANSLPEGGAWEWNQALMDLGATICVSQVPRCLLCPLRDGCRAGTEGLGAKPVVVKAPSGRIAEEPGHYQTGAAVKRKAKMAFAGSTRYYRGRVLNALRALPPGEGISMEALGMRLGLDTGAGQAVLPGLIAGLQRDGLVAANASRVSLP